MKCFLPQTLLCLALCSYTNLCLASTCMVYLFCLLTFDLRMFLLLTVSHNVFVETDPQKPAVSLGMFLSAQWFVSLLCNNEAEVTGHRDVEKSRVPLSFSWIQITIPGVTCSAYSLCLPVLFLCFSLTGYSQLSWQGKCSVPSDHFTQDRNERLMMTLN